MFCAMTNDDDFEPRLGRQRAKGKGSAGKPILHRILAAANLARGGARSSARSGFTGSRIGRGAGVGRLLASRDSLSAYRQRRVMVKARIVRLAGRGLAGAKAHLHYIQRDGTTRGGDRGDLYSADSDRTDRDAFHARGEGDRHQFRFIVSPEDGAEYDDLKHLTRRLMSRMEEDLGTRLDWVAVDHFNTGHPHTHVVLRGRDDQGKDLVIARDYIRHGLRERACELVDLDLGPRDDRAIENRLRAEVTQDRLTGIDRGLLRQADGEGLVTIAGADPFQHAIRTGRLRHLERLGLAEPEGQGWRLSEGLGETLRRMGERHDIVRTLQRAYAGRGESAPAPIDQVIHDDAEAGRKPIVGRVVERGLADELEDRHYLIVDATDGRSHYVAIGKGEDVDVLPKDSIVSIVPKAAEARVADHAVVAVAAAHDGRYSANLHRLHDPSASEDFVAAHVRRLEAMRRLMNGVEREPDGRWRIAADHLARAAAYEAMRARDNPVEVAVLSRLPLAQLVGSDGATWLDRQLTSPDPVPLRDSGFGREAAQAQASRRAWLIEQDLAWETDGQPFYRPDMLAVLRRRELLRVAGQLSDELGLRFVETRTGDRIEGICRGPVELVSGRYAIIEKSREFTLVPWRPVLEPRIGQAVAGLSRENGISWTLGRQRSGPSIS